MPSVPADAGRRKKNAEETRAVAKVTIHRLLSRRDIPLREKTLLRMLYETAARAAEILALNVEDLDLEHRHARASGWARPSCSAMTGSSVSTSTIRRVAR